MDSDRKIGKRMIKLDEKNIMTFENHSSKGNQLKWKCENVWYKSDYTGYEGLVEYTVSKLLEKASLNPGEFISYETEQISYKHSLLRGCKSFDFLEDTWQIITLERLYSTQYGRSFIQDVWKISGIEERLTFLVDQVELLTSIANFGNYICKMLTIDAFFLNEDRHLHNIAVLMNQKGEMKLCPYFDHGAALLADTTLDYPLGADIYTLMKDVKGKTLCEDFDEALDTAENLFGKHIRFNFSKTDVKNILLEAEYYTEQEKNRVETVIYNQMDKYQYLFV